MLSQGNILLMKITLICWFRTESFCHKKDDSLASPEASDKRLPSVHCTVVLNRVWHHVSQTRAAGK